MPKDMIIGIDLGGTNIKAGLVDREGQVLASQSISTGASRGPTYVVNRIVEAIESVMKLGSARKSDIVAVGVGTPGTLNHATGEIIHSPNFPGMEHLNLRDRVGRRCGFEVVIENDANAAAYGEFWIGAGRNVGSLVMVTLGTGIGGGVVADGQIWRGQFGNAGEIGHMIIVANGEQCACNQHGCWEVYASAVNMAKRAVLELKSSRKGSSLRQVLRETGTLTSKDVADAMTSGDIFATEFWHQTAGYIAVGCVNLARILDPEMIVLGGGLTLAGQRLIEPVRVQFQQQTWISDAPSPEIVLATLGNDAGFIGSAGNALMVVEE